MPTTKILKVNSENLEEIAELAAGILKNDGLVAIPTETVYGLSGNALSETAVKKIYLAKGRPCDNPLILHIADISELDPLVTKVPKAALDLAEKFWPGALTVVLKKSGIVPAAVSGGLDTVAVRIPKNEITRKIIKAAGFPLGAPSANISGSPSPTSPSHVQADLDGRIDLIVDDGECSIGVESTVLDLTGAIPCILRPGGVTKKQLEQVLGKVALHKAVTENLEEAEAPSPGMKYRHYAPESEIILIEADRKAFCGFVNGLQERNIAALCFDEDIKELNVPCISYGSEKDQKTQAKRLFSALRTIDGLHAERVYARMPEKEGVGLAVFNRLIRAASFQVKKL